MSNLQVNIGALSLKNPVMTASEWYWWYHCKGNDPETS